MSLTTSILFNEGLFTNVKCVEREVSAPPSQQEARDNLTKPEEMALTRA